MGKDKEKKKDSDPFINYYGVLGVKRGATEEDIKNAYRELAKEHHPDKTGSEDSSKFELVRIATDILRDPKTKALYDLQLAQAEKTSKKATKSLYFSLIAVAVGVAAIIYGAVNYRNLSKSVEEFGETASEAILQLDQGANYLLEEMYRREPITIRKSIWEANRDISLLERGIIPICDFLVLEDIAEKEYSEVPSDFKESIQNLIDRFWEFELKGWQYKKENKSELIGLLREKISLEQRLREVVPSDYMVKPKMIF